MDEYDDIINGGGSTPEEPEKVECTDIYVTLYEDGTLTFASTADNKLDKPIKAEYGNIRGEDYTIENIEDILLGGGNPEDIKAPWIFDILEMIDGTGEYPNAIILDEIVPSSTSWWFMGMSEIKGIEKLNTSNVTKMQCMFVGCASLQELDLSNFNTRNVTDMSGMFDGCASLQELDVSNFDTSNVTDMSFMFYVCASLQELDLSNFDTNNVTDMSRMFEDCTALKNVYVSNKWKEPEGQEIFGGSCSIDSVTVI